MAVRNYDFEFLHVTDNGTTLFIQYTGELDDNYNQIENGRYCVDVDYIRHDCKELKSFIEIECPDLFDEIHDAAVNHFRRMVNIDIKQIA